MVHAGSSQLRNKIRFQGKMLVLSATRTSDEHAQRKTVTLAFVAHMIMREGVKQHVTGSPSHSMS